MKRHPDLILELEARAIQLGWALSYSHGKSGFLVQARREAIGGKCGAPTEYDRGVAFVREELGDAKAQLLTVIVCAVEEAGRAWKNPALAG